MLFITLGFLLVLTNYPTQGRCCYHCLVFLLFSSSHYCFVNGVDVVVVHVLTDIATIYTATKTAL